MDDEVTFETSENSEGEEIRETAPTGTPERRADPGRRQQQLRRQRYGSVQEQKRYQRQSGKEKGTPIPRRKLRDPTKKFDGGRFLHPRLSPARPAAREGPPKSAAAPGGGNSFRHSAVNRISTLLPGQTSSIMEVPGRSAFNSNSACS